MKQALAVLILAILPTLVVAQTPGTQVAPITQATQVTPVRPSNPASAAATPTVTATATAAAPKAAASKVAAAKPAAAIAKPAWAELTAPQQQALKPLATTWSSISESQKRKWLEVSKSYPGLQPAEQVTMHSRMNEWVTMSPQDRATARLNFAKTKELSKQFTPDEKKAKWETYQALSPEEKATLAAKGSPKPAGAATAVKPVPAQKLAATPKDLPALPPLPKVSPGVAVTKTGDTLQNVITPPGKPN